MPAVPVRVVQREAMETSTVAIVTLGLLLLSGLVAGLAASRLGLPRVAAYILAGMVFSPSLLGGVLHVHVGPWSEPLTTVALGFIAYLIGGSMTISQVRRSGPAILGATLGGSLGPILMVVATVLLLSPDIPGISVGQLALVLGVIASTTAPAATVAVLHQYRARGPVARTLLGVVALDDAVGVVLFSLMLVVITGGEPGRAVVQAVVNVVGALLVGAVSAQVLATLGHRIRGASLRLSLILGSILLVVGVAEALHVSPLLASMALGFVARFLSRSTGDRVVSPVEDQEETVFIVFFALAGAHFEPSVFTAHTGLIAAYFGARVVGKIGGAALGTRLVGAPATVVRWTGPGLVPQAGVAVGLALTLVHHPVFAEASAVVLNILLATTVVNELVGPLSTRFALQRAGELGTPRERV